jgi:hypothetical protein
MLQILIRIVLGTGYTLSSASCIVSPVVRLLAAVAERVGFPLARPTATDPVFWLDFCVPYVALGTGGSKPRGRLEFVNRLLDVDKVRHRDGLLTIRGLQLNLDCGL